MEELERELEGELCISFCKEYMVVDLEDVLLLFKILH